MEQEIKQVAETIAPQVEQTVNSLLQYLQSGMHFANEQAPLLVNEIIKWGIFENLLFFVIFLIPLFVCIFMTCHYFRKIKNSGNYSHFGKENFVFGLVAGWTLSSLSIVVSLLCFVDAFRAILAPRLYLIEYLSHLAK